MQLNVNIDRSLFEQAKSLSGLHNASELLQQALQVFVERQLVRSSKIRVSQLESPDMPSLYDGPPLSLEDMQRAIEYEAGEHKW